MDFFQLLEKKQSKTAFPSSSEMRFFTDHSGMLADYAMLSSYGKAQKSFDVIRANIIIYALLNKRTLEDAYEKALRISKKNLPAGHDKGEVPLSAEGLEIIAKAREQLPYFEENGKRIYIPIFSRSVNSIYAGDITKLSTRPYTALLRNVDTMIVDPFDTYGDDLFNSYFTKLILIRKDKSSSAYWDYDASSIYIINKQGRLEVLIALFDRGLKKKRPNHMMSRIAPAIDAFYDQDKNSFQKILVDNQLISSKLLYRNKYDERRLSAKMGRKYSLE